MRENAICKAVATDFVSILHIEGKVNLADLFTKEDKDVAHFLRIRDLIMGECQSSGVNGVNNKIDTPWTKPDPPSPTGICTITSPQPSPGGCQLGSWGSQASAPP